MNQNKWKKFAHNIGLPALAAVGLLLLLACSQKMTVLEERESDRLPVVVQIISPLPGYKAEDTLLALVPATFGKIRNGRGLAEVVAVYNSGRQQWQSRSDQQPQQVRSLDYKFATMDALNLTGILLPSNLSPRAPIDDPLNKAIWVRAGHDGPALSVEVGFGADPLTVRKVLYNPSPDGLTIDLQKGSLLKVKEN